MACRFIQCSELFKGSGQGVVDIEAGIGGKPDPAEIVLADCRDVAVQTFAADDVPYVHEVVAVISAQTVARTYPHEAVAVLCRTVYGIAGESVLGCYVVKMVISFSSGT